MRKADSYIAATENGSVLLNGFTGAVTVKHVTFHGSTDIPISIEETSISNDNNSNATVRKSSLVTTSELKLIHYKLAVAFGICCIVMLFMLPVIFFYVEGGSEIGNTPPSRAIGTVNISQSILCNESTSFLCSDDFVYTYEALRLASEANYPFCINETKNRLPELQNCSDDTTCVKNIMCQDIRQEYCTAEWRMLELNQSEGLIDCSDYGETAPLNCSNQFGLTNNGSVCLPLCQVFSQFSESFTAFFHTWLAVSSGLNVIGGIICLVVSVYKIKKLFKYPQFLIVMNSILISILSLFILISNFPVENWRPLCSKQFVFDAFNEPSVLCEVLGFTYYAITSLYAYFWLLYTLHLFLRIASPLRMIKLEQSKYAKTVHVVEVTFVVLLATVPYIVFALQHEFRIATFPPLYCGVGPRENFYGSIVPTILASCASLIMMVIMLYKIHVHKGIFRRRFDGSCKFCSINLSISEVKIFCTFCYLLIVMVLQWTTFSIANARFNTTIAAIRRYSVCLSGGIRRGLDCEPYRREIEAQTDTGLLVAYFTLFSFLSYSNLPFLIQFKTVKLFAVNTARRLSRSRSTRSTGSNIPLK